MKYRSSSAHQSLKNSMVRVANPQLIEVNNKINNLLSKSKHVDRPNDESLSTQYNYSKALQQMQREKNALISQIIVKDGIIREQSKKIVTLNVEVDNLRIELQSYSYIPIQMEQLEMQCQSIIKENQQLKQQVLTLQTSYAHLHSEQMQFQCQEILRSYSRIELGTGKIVNLLEFACSEDYNSLKNIAPREYTAPDISSALKLLSEQMQRMILSLQKKYDEYYDLLSHKIFDSYNS